jgi:carbamoyl-phosphate synthase small subunit
MSTILPQKRKALLILENGEVFYGHLIGAEGRVYGEIIFNTSMTGYQEILSDPSYAVQIILFTFPHIGNVGINQEDQESEAIWSKGVILRSFSSYYGTVNKVKFMLNFFFCD